MSTLLIIVFSIIGAMILFSLLDKGERVRMKKAGEIMNNDTAEKKARDIVSEIINESASPERMEVLVGVIQMNYAMNNVSAEVSYVGDELILNLLDENIVRDYYQVKIVLDNRHLYTYQNALEAERYMEMLKQADKKSMQAQTTENRVLFKKAGARKMTTLIDGNHISTFDIA